MNISQEKEHIYMLMRNVVEERRSLTEMYYELKKRLDDLSRLEEQGLDRLNTKGIVDMYNENRNKTIVENVAREVNVTPSEVKSNVLSMDEKREKNNVESRIEKDMKKQKAMRKGNDRVSIDRIASVMTNVLREKGRPMKVSEIYGEVNNVIESNITISNFRNNIMNKINHMNNIKIERVTHGYYQYKGI